MWLSKLFICHFEASTWYLPKQLKFFQFWFKCSNIYSFKKCLPSLKTEKITKREPCFSWAEFCSHWQTFWPLEPLIGHRMGQYLVKVCHLCILMLTKISISIWSLYCLSLSNDHIIIFDDNYLFDDDWVIWLDWVNDMMTHR